MSFGETIKTILSYLTGEAVEAAGKIQDRIEETTRRAIKASILYIVFLLGFLFVLIGLANYLQATNAWTEGTGLLVIGGALLFLGLLVKALK